MTASLKQCPSPSCQTLGDDARKSSTSTVPSPSLSSPASSSSSLASTKKKHRKSFRTKQFDNVEHKWDCKPFVKDRVRFLFGGMSEAKMDRVVSQKRQQLVEAGLLADPDGLVLNDMCSAFKCKLLFSIHPHSSSGNDNGIAVPKLPDHFKIKYLSGTWLSKVYRGTSYDSFLDWVDDAAAYVQKHYGKEVNPHQDWFTYYPSVDDKRTEQAVLVFFIKVSD